MRPYGGYHKSPCSCCYPIAASKQVRAREVQEVRKAVADAVLERWMDGPTNLGDDGEAE